MTLHDLAWFAAGLCLGVAGGLSALASEQHSRARQVRALVEAYEARIARILSEK